MTAAALAVALASSVCYALAAALQQHQAGQADTAGGLRLLAHLVTRPRWLLGVMCTVAGASLHVLALRLGPLALVQPIGVTGLVFALPIGAALHGQRVSRRQVLAALAVAVGLGGLLASLQFSRDPPQLSGPGTAVLAAGTAGVVLVCALVGRRLAPRPRSVVFAVGSGVAFGVTSALVRVVAVRVGQVSAAHAVFDWPTLLLLTTMISGLALCQSAYQVGSLASVLPTVTVVDPVTAITVGLLVLHEPIRLTAVGAVVAGLSAAVIVAGTVVLARHQAREHAAPPATTRPPGERGDPLSPLHGSEGSRP
jgi:drug/metabolite transporter (DMT)-like permease